MKSNKYTKISKPLVSVIMPVYNAGGFLVEAIESILKQTYTNFEFLIVDDGSKDNSWEIITKYKKKFPKLIKTYRLKRNTNAAGNGAVNAVLPQARGLYIARMDADDVAHPKRLEKQVRFLSNHPRVILVGTQARVIDRMGNVTGKKSYPLDHTSIYKKYAVVHPIIHPSCIIRRSMLPDQNRLYQMRFGVNDDYYTFFTLQKVGQFANLPDYLLDYRVHGHNASLQNLKEKYFNITRIRDVARKELGYSMTLKARIIIVIQTALVRVIPESLLVGIYLALRGMSTKQKIFSPFTQARRYVASML